jgi:hypothetical protein
MSFQNFLVRSMLVVVALSSVGASPAGGQSPQGAVLLQLRPKAGDLLRLRLDQTIETRRESSEADTSISEMTTLVMLARIQVESTDPQGATVLASADSVRITSDSDYPSAILASARALEGQRFRFRVATDGATTMSGGQAWAAPAVGSLLSQLPATLPRDPVALGASWTRAVEIPLVATPDEKAAAILTATFRFDSLSRSGEFAYLSIRGRLIRSGPVAGSDAGDRRKSTGFVQTSGSVTGTVLIDRRRGWITDAHTVIALRSLVSGTGKDSAPVRVRMKITQWMRVM